MAFIDSFVTLYLNTKSSTALTTLFFLAATFLAYLLLNLYKKALPKAIPGIPYSPKATRRILGDLPDLVAVVSKTGDASAWFHEQAAQHDSPLCQIFIQPLGPPILLLSDFREAQDVCMRHREFGRGSLTADLFKGPIPLNHITFGLDDKWKAHRRLLQDLMSPPFLQNAAGPAIYANVLHLINLWHEKARIADGRPFSAGQDMLYAALDAVTAFSFGKEFPHNATKPVLDLIYGLTTAQVSELRGGGNLDDPIEFPSVKFDDVTQAILDMAINIERLQGSILPVWKWKFIEKFPSLARTVRLKNLFITEELKKASEKPHDDDGSWTHSAVDLMVQRERKLAQDEKRMPEVFSPMLQDELFGFILAGHDTTSTTMLWGLKLLADHPSVQSHLRTATESGYVDAFKESRQPSIEEIMQIKVPYLDAVAEEILRCAGTVPLIEREALCDTVLLGYPIPKGTKILCLGQGASIRKSAYKIDEARRSEKCRSAPEWDAEDVAAFKPVRWLRRSDVSGATEINGERDVNVDYEFDSAAGPQLAFGLGKRGCFGKRLARVELRVLLSLILWNFEIQRNPEELSGYAAKQRLTYHPAKSYVRLKKVRR